MGRKPDRHMSHATFLSTIAEMRMSREMQEAAYMFLVEKKPLKEIEEASGILRQSIQRKAREIYERYLMGDQILPPGWVQEEVALPSDKMEEVKALSRKLLVETRKS